MFISSYYTTKQPKAHILSLVFATYFPRFCCACISHKTGWGGGTRTPEWKLQRLLPYHLATPQYKDCKFKFAHINLPTPSSQVKLISIYLAAQFSSAKILPRIQIKILTYGNQSFRQRFQKSC